MSHSIYQTKHKAYNFRAEQRVSSNLIGRAVPYMYGLLAKCEVKMAGYWPSSFLACLWIETESRSIFTQKKNEANIKPS